MNEIITRALGGGRLAWKLYGHEFQSCNGGDGFFRDYLPTNDKPGPWLPEIEDISECERGYHVTLEPHIWIGSVVFLVETKVPITKNLKQVVSTYRMLRRVYSDECVDPRLFVQVRYPYLNEADLRGANLIEANLNMANLVGADLGRANLTRANLRGANLTGADLGRANLGRANLVGANLGRANLGRADLGEANLTGADLTRADLYGANRYSNDPEIPGWEVVNGRLRKKEEPPW